MTWVLYRFEGWSMDETTRVFIAGFNCYATAFDAQARFIDANPDVPNALVRECED
jgi:hypothetical protein